MEVFMGVFMSWGKTYNRKKVLLVFLICLLMLIGLIGRLVYLMVFKGEYYTEKAETLHERERDIKAARGRILDAEGVVLADNRTVCTVSVIHSQIEDPEAVIAMLQKELGIDEATARKRVEKVSSIERIKTNVDKEIGDRIRSYGLAGVKVDEDYKRYYPFGSLASKVLGFTGGDNQGIIGLEVTYDEVLTGINGQILTLTDARGIELEGEGERRIEPVSGYDLQISLDYNIQMYAQQAALRVMEEKQADGVSIILMNPQNGEINAMVNVPEFDLNDPFTLTAATYQSETGGESEEESTDTAYSLQTQVLDTSSMSESEIQDALNRMWRNPSINDTYEPGSTVKPMTVAAA